MNGFDQYLVVYLLSQVVAIVCIMVAYKSTRMARLLFALMFLWASGTNFSIGFTNPESYLDFGKMAIPLYKNFINGWFSHYDGIIIPIIAFGQLLIAVGMLLKGSWVKLACLGTIVFLFAIAPLGVGSAFPFSLFVSWAALVTWRKDAKSYLWKKQVTSTGSYIPPADGRSLYTASLFLSQLAILLTIVACISPYFSQGIYRDNEFVKTAWHSNDIITLVCILPALIITQLFRKNGKARMVWMGFLTYLIYNYSFYLFGAAFSALFPVYVGIVASSLYALVALVSEMPVREMIIKDLWRNVVIGYLLLIAFILVVVELPATMDYSFTGKLPEIVVKTGHPTSIVYALDLTLVVPACIVAVYWIIHNKRWGYILATMMLVKGVSYGVVLCTGTLMLKAKALDHDPLLPFYIFVAAAGLAALIGFLYTLKIGKIIDGENIPVSVGKSKIRILPTVHQNP